MVVDEFIGSIPHSPRCMALPSIHPSPPLRSLLRQPDEAEKAALRHRIYTASRRTIPLPALHRLHRLDDLRAIAASYSNLRAAPLIVAHVHRTLPRRMLALCTAAAFAAASGRPLLVAWSPDAHCAANFSQLFAAPPPHAQLTASFWPELAPPALFRHFHSAGHEPSGRRRPLRLPPRDTSLYLRLAGPLDASPPVDPQAVRACLRSLTPLDEVGALARGALNASAPLACGVHFHPTGGAGEACVGRAFAARLAAARRAPRRTSRAPPPPPRRAFVRARALAVFDGAESLAAARGCGDASSLACVRAALAEWQILSSAPLLLLTQGSMFSMLVARTAERNSSVWFGCQGKWVAHSSPPSAAAPSAIGAEALDHLLVLERSQLLFCYIPKVACTSWRIWLRKLSGYPDFLNTTLAHSRGPTGLRTLGSFPPEQRQAFLRDFRKVVFVRDPWSRLLSVYLNKFVQETADRRAMWLRQLLKPLQRAKGKKTDLPSRGDLSFDRFVDVLEETFKLGTPSLVNEHWALQSDLCALHLLRYDFVGNFEYLHEDVQALSDFLGFEVDLPSGREYGWEGNRNASRLLGKYYTSRTHMLRVANLYRTDLSVPTNAINFNIPQTFGIPFQPHHK